MGRIGRVAFLGTGSFGVPLLRRLPALADALLVISAPDRPAGRGLQTRPAPIAAEGRALGLPVITPARLRSDEGRAAVRDFAPDGLLLAAYGQLVPADLLSVGERPPLNVHPSLLPRHRGADPVAGAILAGDAASGVTVIVMTAELDAGPIVAQWMVPLTGREQAPELEARLAELAATEVPAVLDAWAAGALEGRSQDPAQVTMIHAFRREDGRIDWSRSAEAIDRQVRALQPWPGAWTTLGARRLHLRRAHPDGATAVGDAPPGTLLSAEPVRVSCGSGTLVLDDVQPEGRGVMPAADWRRGLQMGAVRLGD